MAKAKFNILLYPYPECREQHIWRFYDGSIDEKAQLGYKVQKCENCPSKRHLVISMVTGKRVTKNFRYDKPEDYAIPGGITANDKAKLVLRNFLEDLENGSQ